MILGGPKLGAGLRWAPAVSGLMHIAERGNGRNARGPTMLALAPTRELATQIQEECMKFGSRIFSLVCLCVPRPRVVNWRNFATDRKFASPPRVV